MKMKTTSIKITEVLHRAAKTAAIDAGLTFQDWIANALKNALAKKGGAKK